MSSRASLFTVQAPPGALEARAERLDVLAEGFSWRGFAFGPLWLLSQKLWLAGVAVLLFDAAINAALLFGALNPFAGSLCMTLASIWVGLEGPELRRRKLARKGASIVDWIVANGQEAAEALALRRMAVADAKTVGEMKP